MTMIVDLIVQPMNQTDHYLSEKKKTELITHELVGKIKKELAGLRAKTYSYLIDDSTNDKKAKGTKKCVMKRKLNKS